MRSQGCKSPVIRLKRKSVRTETAIGPNITNLKAANRVPRLVMPGVKAGVIIMDAGLTILCFLMAFKLREDTAVFSSAAWAWSQAFVPYAGILYFAVPVRILMMV